MTSFGAARSDRDYYRDPPGMLSHVTNSISKTLLRYNIRPKDTKPHRWRLRSFLTVANALAILWLFVLNWGERRIYNSSIEKCDWRFWEDWPQDARPHRIMLVADPQLVDPHTYPGRPWPLSTLTIKYTDLYLSRVFRKSMHELAPQSTIFLGDLFDGGREWSTGDSHSPDEQWHKYGGEYWLNEYSRFGNIFFKPWAKWQRQLRGSQGEHRLLASLPGNHDLGFAAGIQKPVRRRFNAYFGDGNRIDVIGNHTFVSLDTVSLSAMETDAPEDVWKPAVEFLDDNRRARRRLISRQMKALHGENGFTRYESRVKETEELAEDRLPHPNNDVNELPLILLTHVPLYRDPGTPCGPLRERWPPTPPPNGQKEPLAKDNRNAISVSYGYQYQNVLSQAVTKKIINTIGIVQYAFSGDDHDYCELTHRGHTGLGGGVKEITVKSLSWAMGVRKPAFLQVSLWNPVNVHGKPLSGEHKPTMQTNLCLLPDQLGIFIRYALLFGLTLVVLGIRATIIMRNPSISKLNSASETPLLPTVRVSEKIGSPQLDGHFEDDDDTAANSSMLSNPGASLSMRPTRTTPVRTRDASPANGYGVPASAPLNPRGGIETSLPLIAYAGYYGSPEKSNGSTANGHLRVKPRKPRKPLTGWYLAVAELQWSVARVGLVAGLWYWWLLRTV